MIQFVRDLQKALLPLDFAIDELLHLQKLLEALDLDARAALDGDVDVLAYGSYASLDASCVAQQPPQRLREFPNVRWRVRVWRCADLYERDSEAVEAVLDSASFAPQNLRRLL